MSNDCARRAMAILESALDIDPPERAEWLKGRCGGDAAVEAEVMSLLALLPEASRFLPVPDELPGEALTRAGDASVPLGAPSFPLAAGDRIGDFLVDDQIGIGGMGVVYRARQISLERDVALKILPSSLRYSANAKLRFYREVEAAARLKHENIVTVFTMGEEAGTPYYAMELIDGFPLSDVIGYLRQHPIPAVTGGAGPQKSGHQLETATGKAARDEAIVALARRTKTAASLVDGANTGSSGSGGYFEAISSCLAEVADGLDYAHQNQVIHRDIKPSNLLLSSRGRLHISDFGLARLMDEPGVTRSGEFVGTAFYMSPEQITANPAGIDGRSDIYSLGATLYELLTLRPPFIGESREQIIRQILESEPLPPRKRNRHVPRDLQTICLKALDKEPLRRYASAADLASDLRAFVSGSPISAKPLGPISRTSKWARRHKITSLSLVGVVFLAIIAGFFAFRAYESERRWTESRQQRLFEEAVLAAMQGDADTASVQIDRARALGAPAGRIHLLQGQADWHTARYGSAYEHFRVAADQLPDNLAAQSLLTLSLMRRQDYARGESMMPVVRQLTPRRLEDYLYRARLENYYEPRHAIELLDQAVRRDKTSIVARLVRGDVYMARATDTADPRDAELAIADFEIAHELLGDVPIVMTGLLKSRMAAATAYQAANRPPARAEQLQEAMEIVEWLQAAPNQPQAHRLRALFFNFIGDTEQALAEWRKIEDSQIVFLVLTLYRQRQYDEALEVCATYLHNHTATRMTDFFRAFVVAGSANSADDVRQAFEVAGRRRLDPMHEVIITQTMGCLLGDVEAAQAESRRLRESDRLPRFRHNWYRDLVTYTSGNWTTDQLLEQAGTSRRNRCEAHYYAGLHFLAGGDRQRAAEQFEASVEAGVYNYFEHFLSQALLSQLKSDPSWPAWLPTVR